MPAEDDRATVRPANREDAATITRLVIALAEFEKLPPPDGEARARLIRDTFGPRPRIQAYLAEIGGEAVGYAFVFETYSSFLALPTLYLEDLFVLPQHRGEGAGYALFTYCAQEAIRRGCGRLDWAVLDWNTHAIHFYERLGARYLDDWRLYRLEGEALAKYEVGRL